MRKWKGDVLFLLVVGALVVGWITLYPDPVDSPLSSLDTPADLHVEELDSYASPEGLKLAYRLYEPEGKVTHVLVLLHDTLLHGGWYETLARGLAERGIAVYLPDRRGWGHSDGNRREVSEDRDVLTEDITAMLAAAQARYPQRKVFLGGHGRGAGLVMRYVASSRPVPGVILISPFISEDQPNLRPEGWQQFVTVHPGEAFLARAGLAYWPVWRYNWPQSMAKADPLLERKSSTSWQKETVPDDLAAAYDALNAPLLLVQGKDDPLFDADKTGQVLASFDTLDRQLETVPNADYLSVINVAAEPIANWLAAK
jgi:alpha-beta hydrolase superfamily lysophospholipase